MVVHSTPPKTGVQAREKCSPSSAAITAQWLRRDRVILVALLLCGLITGFQIWLTVVHPAWSGQATDWFRAAMAWPQLATVLDVSWRLKRTKQPSALSWWMWSIALASYTIARNLWTIYDQLIYH